MNLLQSSFKTKWKVYYPNAKKKNHRLHFDWSLTKEEHDRVVKHTLDAYQGRVGFGDVLRQVKNGQPRVISSASCSLSNAVQRYLMGISSTLEKDHRPKRY